MKKVMPQEIEVWYLIPALRKELAKIFIKKYKLKQKKAAEILGITEAAVSQYLKDKRGTALKFSKIEKENIDKTAKKIIKNPENLVAELYTLCGSFRGCKNLCDLHKKKDESLPDQCQACLG